MQVQCPSCGAVVPSADVNLDRMLAKCARCSSVFDISSQVGRAEGGGAPRARARRLVPMPTNIRIVADEDEAAMPMYRENAAGRPHIVLERRWFSGGLFFLMFFCLAWDGFLVFWYANVFRHPQGAWLVAALFPVVHVSVGVGLTYSTLCGLVNRTTISVKDGILAVAHGPLPWRGNRRIAVEDLAQLYCQEHVGSKDSRTYSLNAVLKAGDKVPLLRKLSEPDQALYVEQILERRLGIVDVPVAGEYT